jgi:hypothetical protein
MPERHDQAAAHGGEVFRTGTVGGVPAAESLEDTDDCVGVLQVGHQTAERGPQPVLLLRQMFGEQLPDFGVMSEEVLVEVLGHGGAGTTMA